MLFQEGALFDSFNVAENVAFPLFEQGLKDRQAIFGTRSRRPEGRRS